MPWKAPIKAETSAFAEPEPDHHWSARRRSLAIGFLVSALALFGALSIWRSNSIPERISWCNRDWIRSSGLEASQALPPDVTPLLPWTAAKQTSAGSFYLPLSTASRCPTYTPTVGYLQHDNRYFSYALSGGP
jgi:hypothetical protein